MKSLKKLLALMVFLAPVAALAHPGHDGHELTWDFKGGLGHPFGGWDHLLAMLGVGLYAARLGGRARWMLPLSFVGTMLLAALAGRQGLALGGLEQGIAASLLALGLLLASSSKVSIGLGAGLVSLFAVFHGYAHGVEMPASSGAFSYALGFASASLLLHGLGLLAGAKLSQNSALSRAAGALLAVAGIAALSA